LKGIKVKKISFIQNLKKNIYILLVAVIIVTFFKVFKIETINKESIIAPNSIKVLSLKNSENLHPGSYMETNYELPEKMLFNITEYENTILYLINNIRINHGENALVPDQLLMYIAESRSLDMENRNYFSHHTPEGNTIFNFFRYYGIKYKKGGENLAQSNPISMGTPENFVIAWLNSPSHKANILTADYKKIGIGVEDYLGRRVLSVVFMG